MYYFDFASTTPVAKEVFDEMKKYFSDEFGNPLSLHRLGQNALGAVDFARETIKNIIEADSVNEIIFTSSATESNNLIIKGIALNYFFEQNKKPHLISTTIEHSSVLETLKALETQNIAEISLISPEKSGLINLGAILRVIRDNTILVSLHYINSETGIIQPIKEISQELKKSNSKITLHIDASQSLTEDISVKNLGVDAMTLSSHKIYGPKGIALLCKREKVKLSTLITGPSQEFGLRLGTENVAGIVGFAKALEMTRNSQSITRNAFLELRTYFIENLKSAKIDFEINAPIELCSPNILNIYFPKTDSQGLLIYLSENNICVSAGMSCKARAPVPSPVIKAMYPNSDRSKKSIRFSLGKNTTQKEIRYLAKILGIFFT